MIFAMSDIHAHFDLMKNRIEQIKPYLDKSDSRIILLGDYIDQGRESFKCLELAYNLEQEYGKDRVIVLKGNHEEWFQNFLSNESDEWLAADRKYITSATFLTKEEIEKFEKMYDRDKKISYIIETITNNHKELIGWLRDLRYFYETSTQIFVHAGVDEDFTKETIEYCTKVTQKSIFIGKPYTSKGYFVKDIIAGHIPASIIARDSNFKGIYFDGKSHFYIDGGTSKTKRILCLVYDEEKKTYYEFLEDNSFKKIGK